MSTDLKVYKQITYIELFDGELIPLAEDYQAVVTAYNDGTKAMDLGNEILNKTAIKRIYPQKIDEVDNEILHITDKNLRNRIKADIDSRRKEWKRVNLAILSNIIAKYEQQQ